MASRREWIYGRPVADDRASKSFGAELLARMATISIAFATLRSAMQSSGKGELSPFMGDPTLTEVSEAYGELRRKNPDPHPDDVCSWIIARRMKAGG